MPAWLHSCSPLDWLLLAAALFLVVRGFVRGCSGEIGRLIGAAAAAAALLFARAPAARLAALAPAVRDSPFARGVLALTLLIVAAVSVWLLAGRLFARLIKLAVPQPLDAILGGVIGAIKVFLLIFILCVMGLAGPRTTAKDAGPAKDAAPAAPAKDAPGPLENWSAVIRRATPWVKPFTPAK